MKIFFSLLFTLFLSTIKCDHLNSSPLDVNSLSQQIGSKSFLWSILVDLSLQESALSSCLMKIRRLSANLTQTSLRLIDSSATLPSGIFDGSLTNFGDYDECLAIKDPKTNHQSMQHCIVKLKPRLNGHLRNVFDQSFLLINDFPLHLGICLPEECTPKEITELLKHGLKGQYDVINETFCDWREKNFEEMFLLSSVQLICLFYILAMIVIVIISTGDDIFSRLFGKRSVLTELSAFNNTLALLSKNHSRFDNRKASIDFSRFVWVVIIIASHSSFCGIEPKLVFKLARIDVDFAGFFSSFLFQPLFNTAVIEGFFYIGGFVTFLSMSATEMDLKSNFLLVVNRWLRFMPGLMSLMAIEFVWPKITYGPMVKEVSASAEQNCLNNWWKNFLFISNWDKLSNMCLTHSWYISADFQLFLLAVIIVWILKRCKFIGMGLMWMAILAGMVIPGYQMYHDTKYPSITLSNRNWQEFLDYINDVYLPTTGHLTPYFLGVLCAYRFKQNKNIFGKRFKSLLWIIFSTLFLVISFIPAIWNTFKWSPHQYYSSVIYMTLYRLIWTVSFAFGLNEVTQVVAKIGKKHMNINLSKTNNNQRSTDQFRLVNLLLGASRLYFSMYLVHSIVLRYFWSSSRHLYNFGILEIAERTIHIVAISFVVAACFYLIFEAPFENIRKTILKPHEKTIEPSK